MRRSLFMRIHDAVVAHDPYFLQKKDALGVLGLSSFQKLTAAYRMLAYGITADDTDEYCRKGESTALNCLKRFVLAIREIFEAEYLRHPTREDITKQLEINAERGFPGMFGSIDCMHYRWKNCPVAWQGQFTNKDHDRSIILEAIADKSLWIRHCFFGLPGSNNYLNVLDRSPLIANFLMGDSDMNFTVNGNPYSKYFFLPDGIYPEWSFFVQSIHEPQGEARQWYAQRQEAVRKDVERAFGLLQSRFAIIQNPSTHWYMETITDVLKACVILHNMVIEDETGKHLENLFRNSDNSNLRRGLSFHTYMAEREEIEDSSTHFRLRNALVQHLWNMKGMNQY